MAVLAAAVKAPSEFRLIFAVQLLSVFMKVLHLLAYNARM